MKKRKKHVLSGYIYFFLPGSMRKKKRTKEKIEEASNSYLYG